MPKEIHLVITVPDEVDPIDIVNVIIDDFYYSNKNSDDFGPLMDDITFSTRHIKEEKEYF